MENMEDKILGAIFLFLSLPVLVIFGILIKITSRGPLLFIQPRHGLNGKLIRIYKLRTMSGKKVTAVGQILRRLSIDELPQFYNVIRGDMVLVGPRPHPVELNDLYCDLVPGFHIRHNIKPGMTGLAQISGARGPINSLRDMRRRLRFDIIYIKNKSLGLDLKIIFLTIMGGFVYTPYKKSKAKKWISQRVILRRVFALKHIS